MRFALYRGSGVAVLLLCAAAAGTAQPPSVRDKLKADTAALATEVAKAESASAERAALTKDLRELLKRFDRLPPPNPMTAPPAPSGTDHKKDAKTGPGIGAVPVDRLRAAMNLVQAGEINAALNAFRQLNLQELAPEDRAFARFMEASCLRRLGRTAEALPIYREVGDANEEPFVASSAVSQVGLLRTSEDLQAQLAKLRERTKSR